MNALKKKIRLLRAYKSLFNSEDGRLVLNDLMKVSGYYLPVTKPRDAVYTAFLDGKRAMMTEILRRTHVSQERIARVYRELLEEEEERYERRNDERD